MPLPEAQWSKDHPMPMPQIHVPFKERVFKILMKAVAKDKEEAKKAHKPK